MSEWINNSGRPMPWITTEHKKEELSIHATIQTSLKITMLSGRDQAKNQNACCMIPFA